MTVHYLQYPGSMSQACSADRCDECAGNCSCPHHYRPSLEVPARWTIAQEQYWERFVNQLVDVMEELGCIG